MKRSWIMSMWLCWLCVSLVSAQPVAPAKTKVTKAVARLMTRAESYEPHFIAAAHRYGLDPRLLWVVAYLETRFNPWAVSPKGARGMMQFMPATATRYGLRDPHEAASAIDAAARYLRDLLQRYGQRVDLALAAYNAGETAVDAALQKNGSGIPPYRETQGYVRRGLQLLQRESAIAAPTLAHVTLPRQKRSASSVAASATNKDEKSEEVTESEEAIPPAPPRGVVRHSIFMHAMHAGVASAQAKPLNRRSHYFGARP